MTIVHARAPKRRRAKAAHPNMPTIVGPPPRSLDPDPETLRRADKSHEVWLELVRRASESE